MRRPARRRSSSSSPAPACGPPCGRGTPCRAVPPAFDGVSRGPCANSHVTASLRPSRWQLAHATQWFCVDRHVVAVGRVEELLPEPEVRRHRVGRQRRERVAVLRRPRRPSLVCLHLEGDDVLGVALLDVDLVRATRRRPPAGARGAAGRRWPRRAASRRPPAGPRCRCRRRRRTCRRPRTPATRGPETTSPKAPLSPGSESSLACTDRRASWLPLRRVEDGQRGEDRVVEDERGCGVSVPEHQVRDPQLGRAGSSDDVVDAADLPVGLGRVGLGGPRPERSTWW